MSLMSLTMLIGRSGTNKSAYILHQIKETLQQNPEGKPIYYIVPEQMTFQEEYTLLQDDNIKGSIRAQVVNFSRLAFRVLQETGGSTKQFITSTGTQMMLRKIIEDRTEHFLMFQKAVDKHGFIQELEGMITELKRHCITPEMLYEQIAFTTQNEALTNKLTDIHFIYAQLQALLQQKYIDGEDRLQMLADKIEQTPSLRGARIYINGFFRFSPKELEIIRQLLHVCDEVTIALTVDEGSIHEQIDELDLFYQTVETYHHLSQLAQEESIKMNAPIVLSHEQGIFQKRPYMYHLEQCFDDRPAPALHVEEESPIRLREAVHPRAEVEGMIQEILRLVRDEKYRYRDIVIFHRESDTYNDLIQTLFTDFNIPFFIDEKRTMLNHPFIEFIRSLFDVVQTNWRYDAIFRLLKTGFIEPTDEEYPLTEDAIDQLENYCLEYGIRQKRQWTQEEPWEYRRFYGMDKAKKTDKDIQFQIEINAYRNQVVQALFSFDDAIRRAETIEEKCTEIYALLEKLQIPTQLERAREAFDLEGKIEKGREEEQVWNGFMQLLDEFVELVGNEKMDVSSFHRVLEAGIESLEFAHVPPTMDHIIVGSIDHSRMEDKKCAFLLGVNEGVWPMKPAVDGMINEQEREFLKQFGMKLAESNRRVLLDDTFYMYLACTKATDYLSLSYVIADSDGKTKTPSPLIERMKQFFPSIQTELLMEPDELSDAKRFITTKEMTRAPLTVQLSRYLRGYSMQDTWWNVLNWYIRNEEKHSVTYNVLQSLYYENKPKPLAKKTVQKLYDKNVHTSVSRLEMMYRCSYQHFVQYSLDVSERRTYKLEAPDIGQLFHEALKTITEWVQREGKDFGKITREEAERYADESIHHLAPLLQHQILTSSNRYKYMTQKLRDVVARATYILSEQARASGFSPVGVELAFGERQQLAPLTIPLSNGYTLQLRGRIDRVDQAKINEQLYLRIIDYKSSDRKLDLFDVYYGLALQMLTYLHVVLSQAEQWLGMKASPGGVLYFHVHDAMLQTEGNLEDEKIADELFKQYKMKGYVLNNDAVAREMDQFTSTGWSDIIPVGFKKDGLYSKSSVANEETFTLLQSHIYSLIRDAGIRITSGEVLLNPYEHKNQHACTFCSFKSICQFDPILKENNFRTLTPMHDEEIILQMQQNEKEE